MTILTQPVIMSLLRLTGEEGIIMANRVEYVRKYQANRDAIMLRPSTFDGARYRSAAEAAGKSVQGFVFEILDKYLSVHSDITESKEYEEALKKHLEGKEK